MIYPFSCALWAIFESFSFLSFVRQPAIFLLTEAKQFLIIAPPHRMVDAGLAPSQSCGCPLTPPDHAKEGKRGRIGLRARTERKARSSSLQDCHRTKRQAHDSWSSFHPCHCGFSGHKGWLVVLLSLLTILSAFYIQTASV